MDPFERLRPSLIQAMESRGWSREEVRVKVRTLTPQEAIGDPEDRDYPLIKGRERMMAARFRGFQGQAFTDMFGDFQGALEEVAGLELTTNFRRAVFLSTLNAVLRAQGAVTGTVHCKDDGPPRCAARLAEMVGQRFGSPRVALVGLQPRMAQALAARFPLRITDLDRDNIGREKFGVTVESPEAADDLLAWCDLALITGTTFSNASVTEILDRGKPAIFYGVTVAGPAAVLGLERFCPLGS